MWQQKAIKKYVELDRFIEENVLPARCQQPKTPKDIEDLCHDTKKWQKLSQKIDRDEVLNCFDNPDDDPNDDSNDGIDSIADVEQALLADIIELTKKYVPGWSVFNWASHKVGLSDSDPNNVLKNFGPFDFNDSGSWSWFNLFGIFYGSSYWKRRLMRKQVLLRALQSSHEDGGDDTGGQPGNNSTNSHNTTNSHNISTNNILVINPTDQYQGDYAENNAADRLVLPDNIEEVN